MRVLLPEADEKSLDQAVSNRYRMQSVEEWEAVCMVTQDISKWKVNYQGIEKMKALLQENPRMVFLTSHFASSILGITLLQQLGVPLLVMSSNVVDNPAVHPRISRFYRKKYTAMGRYMNGGEVLDRENNTSKFVRFLKAGGAVVIVGDLPPAANESSHVVSFLGLSRCFASGAVKLAQKARVPLIAFVCEFENSSYVVRFSEPDQDPYEFIERAIRSNPSSWWAADILPLLPVIE